jgi:hypothetical protein
LENAQLMLKGAGIRSIVTIRDESGSPVTYLPNSHTVTTQAPVAQAEVDAYGTIVLVVKISARQAKPRLNHQWGPLYLMHEVNSRN